MRCPMGWSRLWPRRSRVRNKGVGWLDWPCGQNPGRNSEGRQRASSARDDGASANRIPVAGPALCQRDRRRCWNSPNPTERKRQPRQHHQVGAARRGGGGKRVVKDWRHAGREARGTRPDGPHPPSWTTWQVIGRRSGEPPLLLLLGGFGETSRAQRLLVLKNERYERRWGIFPLLLKLRRRHLVVKHPARLCNGRRNGIRLVEERFKVGYRRIHRSRPVAVFTSQVKTEHNNPLVLALVQHPQCFGVSEPDLSLLAGVASKRSVSVEKIPGARDGTSLRRSGTARPCHTSAWKRRLSCSRSADDNRRELRQ